MGNTIIAGAKVKATKAKTGKKSRKFDRNQKFCTHYANVGRQEINKQRRVARTGERLAKRMARRATKTPKGWARWVRRTEVRRAYGQKTAGLVQ